MGRTLPTFNTWLEHEIADWRAYRRTLRREDQEAFDRLFTHAKLHMAPCAQAARAVPFDALLVSILLEQEKRIAEQGSQIKRLSTALKALQTPEEDGHANP